STANCPAAHPFQLAKLRTSAVLAKLSFSRPGVRPRHPRDDLGDRPEPAKPRPIMLRAAVIDAADDFALGEHVVVFVLPLAGRARGGCGIEDQHLALSCPLNGVVDRLLSATVQTPQCNVVMWCIIGRIRDGGDWEGRVGSRPCKISHMQ